MAVQAISSQNRISPRKVNEVASLVRGRSVSDALVILEHTPRRAAKLVSKTIQSAAANAEENAGLNRDTLIITTLEVNGGPDYKRYRPAAHGRALPYRVRTTHIKVVVDGQEAKKEVKKSSAKAKKSDSKKEKKSDKEEEQK